MNSSIDILIFDLGGVLIELRGDPILAEWLPENNDFTLAEWFDSETAILFEKGLIRADEFVDRLINDLKLKARRDQVIEHFSNWPFALFPDAQTLLQDLQHSYKLAALSNTNEIHWPRILNDFKIGEYCEHLFASHLLQMAKPEEAIFNYVIDDLNIEPKRMLLLDDNLKNVQVAEKLGIQALHVSGIQHVQYELRNLGII